MTTPGADTALSVRRRGIPRRLEIRSGPTVITTIPSRTVGRGGRVEIDQQSFDLERSTLARHYRLNSVGGHPVAAASRTGLRGWDIEVAGGRLVRMDRESLGSREALHDDAGRWVGEIRRVAHGVEADLPELDRPTQVFVLIVALAARRRRRRAVLLGR